MELERLFSDLANNEAASDDDCITDVALKRRVAGYFLEVVSETQEDDEGQRHETAYTIAGFTRFEFDDELDDITTLAGQLELSSDYVEGDPQTQFQEMREMIEDYLSL